MLGPYPARPLIAVTPPRCRRVTGARVKRPLSLVLTTVLGILASVTVHQAAGRAADQDDAGHMMAEAYYFREPTDQPWQLRVVGEIPSLPGCYYVLHDAEGRLLLRRQIPHGTYGPENPLIIEFPRDGRTGDYRLKVLGQQDDLLGPRMPISTLPFEVYGGHYFSASHNPVPVYFKVPPGVEKRNLCGYTATVRVFEGDRLIADAMKQGTAEGLNWCIDVPVRPDTVYRIERKCFYFRSKDGLLLTFDPARWFVPDPKLDTYDWWDLGQ